MKSADCLISLASCRISVSIVGDDELHSRIDFDKRTTMEDFTKIYKLLLCFSKTSGRTPEKTLVRSDFGSCEGRRGDDDETEMRLDKRVNAVDKELIRLQRLFCVFDDDDREERIQNRRSANSTFLRLEDVRDSSA